MNLPNRLCILLVVAAGAVAYANSFAGVFVFDDLAAIVGNARLHRLWPPRQVVGTSLRPLLVYSLAANYAVSGLQPWSYHVVNLAVHLLAATVLHGLVRRTLEVGALRGRWALRAPAIALASSVLWVVHPLQTESVTYIVQRGESMAGLCYLTTLYCVARGAGSLRGRAWYAGAIAAHLCGLATKEIAVTAPLAVLLYDGLLLTGSFGHSLRRRAGLYLGLALPLAMAASWWLGQHPRMWRGDGAAATPLAYALTQPGVLLHYLRLSLWPHPLCLDTRWPLAAAWDQAAAPVLVVAALLLLGLWLVWRHRPAGLLVAWPFVLLAPTSSVVPLLDPVAEHRMYLPLAALAVAAVLAAARLLDCLSLPARRRRLLGTCLLAAATAALGGATLARNAQYHRAVTLWSDCLAQYPDHPRAHNNLAVHLLEEGDPALAAFHWAEALRLAPDYPEALHNIGGFWVLRGEYEQAAASYRKALRVAPDYAEAHDGLGEALVGLGRFDEASAHYEEAIRLRPDLATAHANLAVLRLRQGRPAEAAARFATAARLDPALAALPQALAAAGGPAPAAVSAAPSDVAPPPPTRP